VLLTVFLWPSIYSASITVVTSTRYVCLVSGYVRFSVSMSQRWVSLHFISTATCSFLALYVCYSYYVVTSSVTRWSSPLRHCATSWKVAGSIPLPVIGTFIDLILSVALWRWGSTRPLTEMSRRVSPGGKGGRCVGQQSYHIHGPIF
jgi:hypothetical protein